MSSRTSIEVGLPPAKRTRLKFLGAEMERLRGEIDKFDKIIHYLSHMENLPPEKEQMKKTVIIAKLRDSKLIGEYAGELELLEEDVKRAELGKVHVLDTVYPGVKPDNLHGRIYGHDSCEVFHLLLQKPGGIVHILPEMTARGCYSHGVKRDRRADHDPEGDGYRKKREQHEQTKRADAGTIWPCREKADDEMQDAMITKLERKDDPRITREHKGAGQEPSDEQKESGHKAKKSLRRRRRGSSAGQSAAEST